MKNKLLITTTFIVFILASALNAQQTFTGKEAQNFISGAEMVRMDKDNSFPSYIKFSKGNEIPFNKLGEFILTVFNNDKNYQFKLINQSEDQFKNTHSRYLLTYKGITLQNAMFIVHVNNNLIYAINGNIPSKISIINEIVLTKESALQFALKHFGAQRYKWQMPQEEALLQKETNNPKASYYPKGELVLFQKQNQSKYNYAYCFDIYADKPIKRADLYIDASTGEVLFENNKIHQIDSLGSAVTKFSGTQPITTNYTVPNFNLRETTRGLGIETYNMLQGTNYGNAIDFVDSDNIWNNVNAQKDEIATDAHWAAEKTWDYYWDKFKRNSIDGFGFKLISYVHFDINYANAFWDGQRMTFGDGNTSWQPLVSMDIAGHEITHGLTSFTANLDYSYESGALNEAYSDIFGCAIEFYAKPTQANWLMGENIGTPIRSISNPNTYSQPDTYLGALWYSGTGDNGGVHTNSGVLNYWFYLLSAGGSGTNDNGNTFNISGISIDSAAAIAFRTLTIYLTNTSNYADARYYSIQSAIDLFGPCSPEVQSTTNAFYAVGIGNAFIPGVQSNFTSDINTLCQVPATVNFVNQCNNATNYFWDFGDGSSSNLLNPVHTYSNLGTFDVKLIADGGSCGIDSIIKNQFISILPTNPCIITMPISGNNSMTACDGTIFDNGGSSNYADNSVSITSIKALGAANITLTFSSFSLENSYDYLYVYDGPGTSSPLIGTYTGNNLPNGGSITSTTNRITLKMTADEGTNQSGFVASWHCNMPTTPPQCNFMVSDSNSCVGIIDFTDNSLNGTNNWHWNFGDGNTSAIQDPTHFYQNNGSYTVKLVVSNAIGSDSVIKSNIVTINKPTDPIKPNDTASCGPSSFTFSSTGDGIKWYDQPNSGLPFDTGSIITTTLINASTTIYIEREVQGGSLFGGKTDNSGGGSFFNNNNQHFLVFNCTTPTVLKSVKVYANSAEYRTIDLMDFQGNLLATTSVYVPSGTSQVILNFDIPVQNNLLLVGPPNPNLYRNNGGCNYPYQIGNAITITKCSANQNPTGYYYFFYDWEIQDDACKSNRLPIHININSGNPIPSFVNTSNNLDVSFTNQTVDGNSYLWDFGDGNTSTLTNPSHTYANYGNYSVKLISYNACGTDSITIPVIISLGINEINNEAVVIYPNPTNSIINIQMLNNESFDKIQLYNTSGQLIYNEITNKNPSSNLISINLNQFAKGIYYLHIQNQSKTIIRKIVRL